MRPEIVHPLEVLFEQSRRLPSPRQADCPPTLIVSAFALIMALAIMALAVFYFMQHF